MLKDKIGLFLKARKRIILFLKNRCLLMSFVDTNIHNKWKIDMQGTDLSRQHREKYFHLKLWRVSVWDRNSDKEILTMNQKLWKDRVMGKTSYRKYRVNKNSSNWKTKLTEDKATIRPSYQKIKWPEEQVTIRPSYRKNK